MTDKSACGFPGDEDASRRVQGGRVRQCEVSAEPRSNSLPVVFLVGPTAIGKSRVAIQVAKTLGSEILTADSTQVYLGMDIGTHQASNSQVTVTLDGAPRIFIGLSLPLQTTGGLS